MINRILHICLISITIILCADAQPITSVKPDDLLSAADEAIEDGNFLKAVEMYRDYYRENKNDDVALSIAYGYYKIRDFVNAERYYTRVLEDDIDNIFIDDRYAYGRTLRSLENIAGAQEQFELITELSTDEDLIALSQIELEGISKVKTATGNQKN